MSAPAFAPGDRVRVVDVHAGARIQAADGMIPRNHYVGQAGTVTEVYQTGPLRVTVRLDHDDPTTAPRQVPMSELELEPLVDVPVVEGHGFSSDDPHTCTWSDPHGGPHVCEECGATWPQTPAVGAREIHPGWDNVGAVTLWRAVSSVPGLFDVISDVISNPPADFARVLRDVADVLDGGAL